MVILLESCMEQHTACSRRPAFRTENSEVTTAIDTVVALEDLPGNLAEVPTGVDRPFLEIGPESPYAVYTPSGSGTAWPYVLGPPEGECS